MVSMRISVLLTGGQGLLVGTRQVIPNTKKRNLEGQGKSGEEFSQKKGSGQRRVYSTPSKESDRNGALSVGGKGHKTGR